MVASLEQLGVPPEYRERAMMLWLVTGMAGLSGWIVFRFLWKLDGQEKNQWFRVQLKQALVVGCLGWTCYLLLGLGVVVHLMISMLGLLKLAKGLDFELPLLSRLLR